jgi:plasmid stabilization system protein ParE
MLFGWMTYLIKRRAIGSRLWIAAKRNERRVRPCRLAGQGDGVLAGGLIRLSPAAEEQVDALIAYYESKARLTAAETLLAVIERARTRIAERPDIGLPAPRPYPLLARRNLLWIKERSHWISYSRTTPPVILGIVYATSDIPNRL